MWSIKAVLGKVAGNVLQLATSKTTWLAAATILADVSTNGGFTVASLVAVAGKLLAQGLADHGKNAK